MEKDNKQANKTVIAGESVNEREERTLKFWQDNKIFEKSLEKESPHGEFVFYDGPPFATGLPHYGHILAGTIKDIIPRYKTMKGYHVDRKWGWDCHGLPIENLIEGELQLKTKKDIEELGVGKFNLAAKTSVLRYAADWKKIVSRVGRFVDMGGDYKTMDANYTESIWWIFKNLYDKNLIYEGYKAMHLCPRCETTLANFEVNQGYKDITDLSLVGKFELVDEPKTFVLAWTTTPWTLPGNVALAVNPEIEYVELRVKNQEPIVDEKYILAKSRLGTVKEDYEIVKEFLGEKLLGKSYRPLFDYYFLDKTLKNHENGWKIYGADFVTTEDGTGVVHIAPAFGEDDMALGIREKLPFIQHVGTDGRFRPEVRDFAGLKVKPKDDKELGTEHQSTDVAIIKHLACKGLLFAKEKVVHSYPHCWRCDTPLLNYAASSWFVKVTEFKNRLLKNNQKTSWVPENIRDGRFGRWLEGARDWAISRSRYWGAPLPVWRCADCKKIKVCGSVDDIRESNPARNKYFIMRHGEAESNVSRKVTCDPTGNGLTEVGRIQVQKSALGLKSNGITLMVSSDYTRVKETAEIVAGEIGYSLNKIVYDPRLREVNFGVYNNESLENYHGHFKTQLERFYVRPEGGENLSDVKRRVTEFLYDMDKQYIGENILIIAHGDLVWLLQAGVRGLTPEAVENDARLGSDDGMSGPVEVKFHKNYKSLFYLKNADFRELPFMPIPHNENYELDFHRPFIDEVKFLCECGGSYKRVPEVFDCWFESGAMPYASVHYPFENKEKFEANFPADFIAEGLDQTRGWFYSLMVLSTALFDQPPFEQVVVNGMVLAEDGQKMSKRLKNYPDIMYIIEKYGADAMRFYMINSPIVRSEDLRFSEGGVDEIYKKLISRLLNVLSFYELYSGEGEEFAGVVSSAHGKRGEFAPKTTPANSSLVNPNVLDLWIVESLHKLVEEVEHNLKQYELDKAVRPMVDFVDDFSTWYIRRSRNRFKSDDSEDKKNAIRTTRYILKEFSKILAPFTPFIAEEIYSKVKEAGDRESVHLEDWPFYGVLHEDELNNNKEVLPEMAEVRRIVTLALDARKKAGISVRQPLQKLNIKDEKLKGSKYVGGLLELVMDEVNVKEVLFGGEKEGEVWLDTYITTELQEEGNLRELVRYIQDARKGMGLTPSQKIKLNFYMALPSGNASSAHGKGGGFVPDANPELARGKLFLEKFSTELKKSVTAESINYLGTKFPSREEVKIGGLVFSFNIQK